MLLFELLHPGRQLVRAQRVPFRNAATVYRAYCCPNKLFHEALEAPAGDEKMRTIAAAIQEGAQAYLARQYKTVAVVAIIVFAGIWFFLGQVTAWAFLAGAVASALAGYIADPRTVEGGAWRPQTEKAVA